MWRFLHNIPRALKNCQYPRASVGVYVESDDKEQDAALQRDKDLQVCLSQNQNTHCVDYRSDLKERFILWRLVTRGNNEEKESQTNQDDQHDSWSKNVLALLHGPNHMLEAIVVGSSLLWGTFNESKWNQKSDLLYRVLFSACWKEEVRKSIINQENDTAFNLPKPWEGTQLAIKDAEGSAQDSAINKSRSETLDAALKEFEHMCTDYTAQNESMLALAATERGNMSEAVNHFYVSCSMGNKTACFNLGLCYETGSGVTKNIDKAKHYYHLASVKGHTQASYNLSLLYLSEDDQTQGIHWMEVAARAGLAQAQLYMGVYHMEETGDVVKAAAYFMAAAKQNDTEAQYFLALCHEHGLGLEVNECKAAHLYSLVAGQGHDGAMFSLATFYEHGLGGVPQDSEAANQWYTKAAESGNEDAKKRLEELKLLKQKQEQNTFNTISNKASTKEQLPTLPSVLQSLSPVQQSLSPVQQTMSPHHHLPPPPPTKPFHPSFSTPNLRLSDYSLSDFLFQTLYRNSHNNKPGELKQDETAKVSFFIGTNGEIAKDKEIPNRDNAIIITTSSTSYRKDPKIMPSRSGSGLSYDFTSSNCLTCQQVHKSSTTPDLTAMVACNI